MKEKNKNSNVIIKEIAAVVLVFIGIFLILALISYSSSDPSFNTRVAVLGKSSIKNYGGIIGSYTADLFIQTFGLCSYFVVILLIASPFILYLKKDSHSKFFLAAGFIIFTISICTLFYIFTDSVKYNNSIILSGGFLGLILGTFLVNYLSKPGAYILDFMLLFLGILMFCQISIIKFITYLADLFTNLCVYIAKTIAQFVIVKFERYRRTKSIFQSAQTKAKRREYKKIREHQPTIVEKKEVPKIPKPDVVQEKINFEREKVTYKLPPLSFLETSDQRDIGIDKETLIKNSLLVEKKLADFGILGKITNVRPGPLITMYEFEPDSGIKVSRIMALTDDLAMALRALNIRILAPIPGKSVVGIEIPNNIRQKVFLRDLLSHEKYRKAHSNLMLAIGKDISGEVFMADLKKMPHLLVAGATGTGKSVLLNSLICSILYRATPDQVKLLLIDPKVLELSNYESIPNLLMPVITDPKKANLVLKWVVAEMEKRYKLLAEVGVRHIDEFNAKVDKKTETTYEKLPYIVVIIDEFADLMLVTAREIEELILRLAQMARAAGIHLIIATQRPSTDVITGLIKANFPSRISLKVASKYDAKTILDTVGSENLLNAGDMLFLTPGTTKLTRVHGAYISDGELSHIVEFLKKQGKPKYELDVLAPMEEEINVNGANDDMYERAIQIVTATKKASISMLQRKLRVGYNRAARIIEQMEEDGIVGPTDGVRPRDVLIDSYIPQSSDSPPTEDMP